MLTQEKKHKHKMVQGLQLEFSQEIHTLKETSAGMKI